MIYDEPVIPILWLESEIAEAKAQVDSFANTKGGLIFLRWLHSELHRMERQDGSAKLLSKPEELERTIENKGARRIIKTIRGAESLGMACVFEAAAVVAAKREVEMSNRE